MSSALVQRALTTLVVLTAFSTSACGGDDDAAESTVSELRPATTTTAPSPWTSGSAAPLAATSNNADADAYATEFCAAELEAEAAFQSEDPDRIAEANQAVQAAAPADVADTVAALISSLETGGDGFEAAYNEVIAYMKEHCGFTEVAVTGTDHQFGGVPTSLTAGPAIFSFANDGAEIHQLLVVRLNDDVTETASELAAMTEDEVVAKGEAVGAAFAFPGAEGHGTMNLSPGRHLALCFIPVGATPEALGEAGPDGPPSDGPSHASQGMVAEFEVE